MDHFRVLNNKLSMVMFQRSCDVLVGCVSNWAQYSALLLAMAETLQLEPYEFIHMISDAHLYYNQLPWVEEILERKTEAFPTLKLVNKHTNIKDYRKDDFVLTDYHPNSKITGIPVGI